MIQATMDLIQWFVPLLNRLPRDHRFALGNRLVHGLYDPLGGLVTARYATAKLERLEPLNAHIRTTGAEMAAPRRPTAPEHR
jgi:hypothetical protein